MSKKKTQPPAPEELKVFTIPGYLMPIIAEWLNVSLASLYAYVRDGKAPSRAVAGRLEGSPYFIPATVWSKPTSEKAQEVYTQWYKATAPPEKPDKDSNKTEQNQDVMSLF